jgi:hypothetical protein
VYWGFGIDRARMSEDDRTSRLPILDRGHQVRALLADSAVDRFAKKVCVAGVAGGLLYEMQ